MGSVVGRRSVKPDNVFFNLDARNPLTTSTLKDFLRNYTPTISGATISGTGFTLGILLAAASDKIDFSNISSLNFTTTPLSIVAWIYPLSYGGGSQGRIVDKFKTTLPQTGYALWIDNSIGVNSLRFGTGWSVSTTIATMNNSITLNTWQHVAVTYAGTSCTFYVNGASIGSSGNITNPSSGSTSLVIGNNASGTNNFDGKIDSVKIYNTALTPSDIYQLYTSSKGRYNL